MYRYHLCPGYGSKELLIELLPKSADQVFLDELFGVLRQANATVKDVQDLWVNDEVLMSFESDWGPFEVSKNIWDFVFILAPENQPVILKIDQAMQANPQFQKETVDFDQYT